MQCAAQVLALIGLRSAKELVLRNLDIIHANVAHLEAFCERHSDVIAFAAPKAGSVAFARLLTGEHVEVFCERLVAEAGETVPRPGEAFSRVLSLYRGKHRRGGEQVILQSIRLLADLALTQATKES